MFEDYLFIVHFFIYVIYVTGQPNGYEPWIPSNSHRTDLRCPISLCRQNFPTEVEGCCACRAKPYWHHLPDGVNQLSIEYIKRNGIGVVVGENVNVSRIQHDGFLSKLPPNLCEFTNIVEIDFKHNQLSSLTNISCLGNLDTLDVSYNQIHKISNDTFKGMNNLRILKVTHNNLVLLEPFTITGDSLYIFFADFSYNNQTVLDMSNTIPENNLCMYDFSSNQIKNFINGGNFQLDTDKIYHGGFVELVGNNFTEFFDFDDLGIDDIKTLGAILTFGFSMTDVKLECNCKMVPFLELAESAIKKIWRDYYNISCFNPPKLKGQLITDIVKENRLGELICNLTETEKCPRKCRCVYQPRRNRTIVDCADKDQNSMPKYLPEKHNIELILRNNTIKHIDDFDYLTNVSVLDISKNNLHFVASATINRIAKRKPVTKLNFTQNNFRELQRTYQQLHPCNTIFGDITIRCDCNTLWIRHWLRNKNGDQCLNISKITCQTNNGIILASDLTYDDVCDKENVLYQMLSSIFGILFSAIMGIAGIVYFYRYEIYILMRKVLLKQSNRVTDQLKYDAYISFDENNDSLRRWVVHAFDLQLKTRGYKTFVPCKDLLLGMSREEETVEQVNLSKHYIIMLCESYVSEDRFWTGIEWKYIWHSFRRNSLRNIIIINFGHLETFSVQCPKLKAFLRLGLDLDFANRKHRLINDVITYLGSPALSQYKKDKNNKTSFEVEKLKSKMFWIERNNRTNDKILLYYNAPNNQS